MMTDIEIAQQAKMLKIGEIAEKLGISEDEIEPYGHYKAKLSQKLFDRVKDKPDGKLILVTAINPTPAGEGKTTTSVGLCEGMNKIGKKTCVALREPSLGPVFGIKGGAAGGGYSQVVPMEDINLHFTGDMHAITAANNLLAAMIDNHIQQGNALRNCVVGMGGKVNGIPREDHFQITVASEIMAILCLSSDLNDLKTRLGNILIGYTYDDKPVFARDLNAVGAMTALLRDAVNPNLVQTLENNPAIIHGGPFANIAHGCNSVRATKLALKLSDYVITEAGFGSDLGAEKFFDIKCRAAGLKPDCVVLVATIRALKYNGGVAKPDLAAENIEALQKGIVNLGVHIENMRSFGVPVVVAINHFATDTDAEIELVHKFCQKMVVNVAFSDVFAKGGDGAIDLAKEVVSAIDDEERRFAPIYDEKLSIKEKVEIIATKIYRADGVVYTAKADKAIREIEALGLDRVPICVAKTQYSLSDNPTLLGKPEGFKITVSDVRASSGAGFVVIYTGDIMTMPGLPKIPSAEKIDVDENGLITGLF